MFIFMATLTTAFFVQPLMRPRMPTIVMGKGNKKNKNKGANAQSKGDKQGRADQFDAMTRQFMFTMSKVSKVVPG